MARPTREVQSGAPLPTKLLLAGYFGCGNIGDDAIMLGFARQLKGADFSVSVLTGNPEETYRNYGFHAVQRKDLTLVGKAIENCDCLVFPGGSIFQDVTSVKSVAYYSQLIRKAKASGKKVVLLGQGVGPLNRFLGKRMAAQAFNAADIVSVRDPGSVATLKALGVKKRIPVTADTAFLLPKPSESEGQDNFKIGDMQTVGLSPRPFGKGKDVVNLFGEVARLLFQAKFMPVLVEMDPKEDGPLILEISKQQGGKIPDIRRLQTPMQLQQRLMRMDSVIAMRLHAGILAATVGVPPLMVSYDPKVAAFAKLLDIGAAPAIEGLTAQRLFDRFMEFQRDRERNQATVERKAQEMANLARENIELFESAFRQPATM